MRYIFIVNPMSGKRDAEQVLVPAIHAWFQGKKLDYDVFLTQGPHDATKLTRRYADAGERVRVCACGGDGTFSEVAAGAVGANNIEVALYPCGGGNDFIKCFGAQQDFQSFDAVVNGSPIAIDVLKVNHTYCVNLMSVGVDADVNAGIIKYRKVKAFRGPMAYNLSLVEHLMKPMGKDLILDLGQDLQLEENLILVAAGNGRVYGGGYYATPEARLDDGIIDVVTVGKMPLLRVAKVLGIYKKGDHLCAGEVRADIADKVSFFRTNRLRIRSAQEFVVNIDGESSTSSDVEIQVLKHAVQFVLPPGITYN